ncbi:hypothetical protein F4808DRAFT_101862, partial [Astrocystis sublimbata]
MVVQAPSFPGYTPLTNRIYIRNEGTSSSAENVKRRPPRLTQRRSWFMVGEMEAQSTSVTKYSEGYHALFPSARIVVIINPIFAAATQTLPKRTEAMNPVIDACFPTKDDNERVIMHIMSNTGGIYAAATLNAYRERHGEDAVLPHHLCVSDSTPGGLNFGSEIWRWSRAMAMGVPKWIPLPFKFTQALCAAFLSMANYLALALGIEPAGPQSARIFVEHAYAT